MKSVTVCMGSACHLKEALAVVESFRQEIRLHGLEPLLELKGSFCLGSCTEAVMVKFEERLLGGVSGHNAADVFRAEILPAFHQPAG